MIRQPPTAVPSDSAVADTRMTQIGTVTVGMTPALNSARVMMPIVFWASLEPWAKAMKPAEKTCRRRKRRAIGLRFACRKIQNSESISANAMPKPRNGDVTIGTRTLLTMPSRFRAPTPTPMIVAPIRPPMSAWLLELGRPAAT